MYMPWASAGGQQSQGVGAIINSSMISVQSTILDFQAGTLLPASR